MTRIDNRDWVVIGAACRKKGICPTCRLRKAKKGLKTCRVCLKSASDRRRRWRAEGRCVDCRQDSEGKRRCRCCQAIHQKYKDGRRVSDGQA